MSININDLRLSYSDFNLSIDLQIHRGEFLSILGPSGSGKTTLLRLIAGFIQPEGGRILINGDDITGKPTSKRNIGMVFQDYALFPHLNVYRNIAYGLETRGAGKTSIRNRVSELLEIVNLTGYEKRRISELSGGEKQRVALARAIAPEPDLLLFDEPLSALDVKLRKRLRKEIKRIQHELNFTAVYVTHDQDEAMSVSDRIAVMNGGRIIQVDTAEIIYSKPADFFTADFIGTINSYRGRLFRPEACSLADKDNGDGLYTEAESVSCEYSGGYYICEACAGSDIITFYSKKRIEPERRIVLKIDRSGIINFS